ncbi:hypothetical protein, partial [Enterobacter hormaechei]|uniref:hypothetical protein n=1 Tax=Enterobacter hormaechei TaxID=158836 RepID=UPI001A9C5B2A
MSGTYLYLTNAIILLTINLSIAIVATNDNKKINGMNITVFAITISTTVFIADAYKHMTLTANLRVT